MDIKRKIKIIYQIINKINNINSDINEQLH